LSGFLVCFNNAGVTSTLTNEVPLLQTGRSYSHEKAAFLYILFTANKLYTIKSIHSKEQQNDTGSVFTGTLILFKKPKICGQAIRLVILYEKDLPHPAMPGGLLWRLRSISIPAFLL